MLMIKLVICTVSGASVIVFYSVSIALIQGPGAHFMSLFFLFAAAIFAAMNNHQVLPILVLRLAIYGSAFLLIPAYDIYVTGAAIDSELWAQLFTSVFVLYFVIDCSRVHLTLYRANMNQMAELRVQHARAADALRIKSKFLSTMSHELRTPLTSIRGSIDLIGSGHFGEITPKVKSIVAIAQRNCSLLIHLVDDILDLQKIESGRMDYNMEELNVTELVHQSIASNGPYAERLGIKLALESDDDSICVTGAYSGVIRPLI
ncbi:sensor histidine kinase, partial [Loktanella sp. DJP18]|uniref:sensor histidine kinase n=1 Tax=Loktanella sp. DJP18 TaxID=3409788 RepID=UPI003BB74390